MVIVQMSLCEPLWDSVSLCETLWAYVSLFSTFLAIESFEHMILI